MKSEVSVDSGIYIIHAPATNRVYIGSTNNFHNRRKQHFYMLRKGTHPCHALQFAWHKYGDDLQFIVIERCGAESLIEREQWWIDNHRKVWGRMYNSSGIAGRPEHTPEVRAKISAAQKGRKHSEEHKRKVAEAGRGRKHSAETKARMSAIMRASPERIEAFKKLAKQNKPSAEQIERIAAIGRSHKGKKHTDEARAKMRAAQAARFENANPAHIEQVRQLGLRPKSLVTRAKMSAKQAASWTPERKAAYTKKVCEQRLREHMERLNWFLAG